MLDNAMAAGNAGSNLKRGTDRPTASDQNYQSVGHGLIKDNDADRQKRRNRGKECSGRTEGSAASVPGFRSSGSLGVAL
jgi:hypothetical protein